MATERARVRGLVDRVGKRRGVWGVMGVGVNGVRNESFIVFSLFSRRVALWTVGGRTRTPTSGDETGSGKGGTPKT